MQLDVCSNMAEKQQLKPGKLNFLIDSAFLDTQFDPKVTRLLEICPVFHFVLKSNNRNARYNVFFDHQSNA